MLLAITFCYNTAAIATRRADTLIQSIPACLGPCVMGDHAFKVNTCSKKHLMLLCLTVSPHVDVHSTNETVAFHLKTCVRVLNTTVFLKVRS